MTNLRQRSGPTQFNCFSPPVMLATLTIESLLIIYTIWRYKMSVVTRLVCLSLFMLALFQLCEYHVCTGFGIPAQDWSRLGYVAISTLPALGLHALHSIAEKPKRKLVVSEYLVMTAFIVYFLSYHAAFIGYKCTGNYVIFQIGDRPAILYGLYYYSGLFVTMWLALRWANQLMAKGKAAHATLQACRALFVGYLVFLVPTALANSIDPASRKAIPSIMCGFAVIYAMILTLYVLPRAAKFRNMAATRKSVASK